MIETETKRKLARHFGLKNLDNAGETKIEDAETGEVKDIDLKFVWMAKARKYGTSTLDGEYRHLLVAVVRTSTWRKGLLLVPAEKGYIFEGERYYDNGEKNISTDQDFIGGDALPALDLADDPVEDMLRCVDLTSSHYPKNTITEQEHSFELLIRTPVIRADLDVKTFFYEEEYPNTYIWGAVGSVIGTLQKQYNREDMNNFFSGRRP
jgi:hypothetical protein